MQDKISKKCKICDKIGSIKFDVPFKSLELQKYLNDYYGKRNSQEIINLLKNKYYQILYCKFCKFIWQGYIPSEDFLNLLYEKFINKDESLKKSQNNQSLFSRSYINQTKNILTLFKQINPNELRVLDYGSGWGGWIEEARKLIPNIDGIEFSKSRQEYLLKKNVNILTFEQIKYKKNYYDFIRCEQVIEHLPDITSFFELISNILKSKCYLYLAVPNSNKLINKKNINYFITKGPAQPIEHLNSFTPKSLGLIAKKYGFKEISLIQIFKLYFYDNLFSINSIKNLIRNIYNYFFNTSKIFQKI